MPRKPKKYHYIYKTTNLLNQTFYIGLHSTDNLNDEYLGSGKYLRRSVRKYGKKNFKREILEFTDTREELLIREENIVDEILLKDPFCMNLRKGGGSYDSKIIPGNGKGKTYIDIVGEERARIWKENNSKAHIGKTHPHKQETKELLSKIHSGKSFEDKVGKEKAKKWKDKIRSSLTGKKASNETIRILSESHQGQIPWNKGKTTGMTPWNKGKIGVMQDKGCGVKIGNIPWNKGKNVNMTWIFNNILKESKMIDSNELNNWLSLDWKKGRKIKW